MSENTTQITDEQRKVINTFVAEGIRIERERILSMINENKSKTISVNKLNKMILES